MTIEEMQRRNAAQRQALDQMHEAAAGALGVLEVMRKNGRIAEHSQEHVDSIIARYYAGRAMFDALAVPLEPAA